MSNHSGSYMLNEVLCLLDEQNFFKYLGKEKTLKFLNDVREVGDRYDCNEGEILEEIGEELSICYECWDYGKNFEYGACEECRK